jgi:hypothetical protein
MWKKQLRTERNGSAFFNIPSWFDVHFYADVAGLPGTEVYVATGLAFTGVLDYIILLLLQRCSAKGLTGQVSSSLDKTHDAF